MTATHFAVPAPAALSRGYGLRVIDYDEFELIGKADAAGTATLQTSPTSAGHILRIERMVVLGNSANTCELTVYTGPDPMPQRGRDWSPLPPGLVAVSEYPSYLTIKPSRELTITITGANPGDIFFAAVQYQLVLKVLGG